MLWVIAGPTASGKTSFAIALAKALDTEIISFDSRQFFREIPIGTAAPTSEERSIVTHHFIGNKSITETYSAGGYANDARAFCERWFAQREHLVAVGGSGLYLSALLRGFDDLPSIPAAIREDINRKTEAKGLTWLQEEVQRVDPKYVKTVDVQNPRRLARALEVYRSSGKRLSELQSSNNRAFPVPVRTYGIDWPRDELYARIEQRVDAMMADGLEDEAQSVYAYRTHQALQTVGYRELFSFFNGNCQRKEAVDQIKTNTRRYAKRQLTWFRNRESLTWIAPNTKAESLIQQ